MEVTERAPIELRGFDSKADYYCLVAAVVQMCSLDGPRDSGYNATQISHHVSKSSSATYRLLGQLADWDLVKPVFQNWSAGPQITWRPTRAGVKLVRIEEWSDPRASGLLGYMAKNPFGHSTIAQLGLETESPVTEVFALCSDLTYWGLLEAGVASVPPTVDDADWRLTVAGTATQRILPK